MSKKQTVKLISVTKPCSSHLPPELQTAEGLMAYCARVSSPNQENPDYEKLLSYCAKHGHWSVFELADMTLEIVTSRAIAQQILRHRSFSFQEFSQRYSENKFGYIETEARRQDKKNRQNSIDDMSQQDKAWFSFVQQQQYQTAYKNYKEALKRGIAKECARMLLPLNTGTKLYMKGSIRSWLHYCQVRCHPSTQLEHREIALQAQSILMKEFPSLGGLTIPI
jgi:thymidylate synthase (FAD)